MRIRAKPKMKFRIRTKWLALRRAWCRWRYGVRVPPSCLSQTSRGKYVDVIRRGPYLDITDHREGGTIRLTPFQPNHGITVEFWLDGRMRWRTHLDYSAFRRMGFGEWKLEERAGVAG